MTDDDKALVERLRDDLPQKIIEKHWVDDNDAINKQREEAADRIEALSAEKEAARMEERAAIVAWHRQRSEECLHGGDEELSALHEQSALDIEAGEHLK